MQKYKIADLVFEINTIYANSHKFLAPYAYDGDKSAQFVLTTCEQDILDEQQKADSQYPLPYLENLALFRKFCFKALELADALIFHCSAVAVDGQAYLFTAPSGTGKSTHTRLWRELLGEKAVMINDDKPMIRFIDGHFYVYGTPWNGKHKLGENTRAKIKAVCKLERAEHNKIEKCSSQEMLLTVLNQTVMPSDECSMDRLLKIIEKLFDQVGLYKLGCNMQIDAAKLAYEAMK